MGKAADGITADDLVAYAQKSQELGNKYKVSGGQHVMHLLASMAREAESEFGEKGLEMVGQAVRHFGEERGQCIARIVKDSGKPLTLMNFFLYGDMDISGNEMVPELVNGELHIRVLRCRLADRLKELGLGEYGKHYCMHIDLATLRGYNPKLQLEIKSQLTLGDDCCLFIYRQPREAVESGD
ncbi:MAG: L-2-amino-thiazoline-4-carboxylic acid hydrolase [Candidatus Hydrogenedentota bacterium]|nr:MAG: L-2-amino-thiazoline-4-carboxylic acid hydrolase [Candidatus Hydrogenedentota bacterium]